MASSRPPPQPAPAAPAALSSRQRREHVASMVAARSRDSRNRAQTRTKTCARNCRRIRAHSQLSFFCALTMASSASSSSVPAASVDARLSPDPVAQAALREKKPWQGVPTYFKKVDISAVAAMKMTQHAAVRDRAAGSWRRLQRRGRPTRVRRAPRPALSRSPARPFALSRCAAQAGVEKGLRSAHGMPVEIMGLLHGHPSTAPGDAGTIVVTDVSRRRARLHGVARARPGRHLSRRRRRRRRRRRPPLPPRARRSRCPSRAPRRRSWRTTPR